MCLRFYLFVDYSSKVLIQQYFPMDIILNRYMYLILYEGPQHIQVNSEQVTQA